MESERLILRPWKIEDVKALFDLASDPHVGPDCGWCVHKNMMESEKVLKTILMVKDTYAIVLKESDEVIGNISLYDSAYCENERQKEMGFWLGYPYWKNGYMSEAVRCLLDDCFENQKYEKIWCGYFDYNVNSKKVQLNCGFHYHHTDDNVYLALLDKHVTRIVNVIEKS